ncbi:MAG: hypothetical protein U0930_24610 [Pirellulales bacterium]
MNYRKLMLGVLLYCMLGGASIGSEPSRLKRDDTVVIELQGNFAKKYATLARRQFYGEDSLFIHCMVKNSNDGETVLEHILPGNPVFSILVTIKEEEIHKTYTLKKVGVPSGFSTSKPITNLVLSGTYTVKLNETAQIRLKQLPFTRVTYSEGNGMQNSANPFLRTTRPWAMPSDELKQ